LALGTLADSRPGFVAQNDGTHTFCNDAGPVATNRH
jgi:hypothetical protein